MSTDSGPIRADHNPGFYNRYLLIGFGALAGMAWFLYDGAVKYPHEHERYVAYQELVDDLRGDEWEAYAEERGWDLEPPEKDFTEAEIRNQFYWAAGFAVVGVGFLLNVFMARGRWLESDGQQITTSWGQTVPFDAVVEINKKKWANKGLAYVKYRDGDQTKQFVVDDFKFFREPTDAILVQMEQVAGEDKIVGGPPESALATQEDDDADSNADEETATAPA